MNDIEVSEDREYTTVNLPADILKWLREEKRSTGNSVSQIVTHHLQFAKTLSDFSATDGTEGSARRVIELVNEAVQMIIDSAHVQLRYLESAEERKKLRHIIVEIEELYFQIDLELRKGIQPEGKEY